MSDKAKGVYHLYILSKFYKRCIDNKSQVLPRNECVSILYTHNIPKILHTSFLKEMQDYNMITIMNRIKIRVKKNKFLEAKIGEV